MKILILITFLSFAVLQSYAQNNLVAQIEFEEAEKAYAEGQFHEANTHINKTIEMLGRWAPKVSYLKIRIVDELCGYNDSGDSITLEIAGEVNKYMEFANNNTNLVDLDKFKDVYAIDQKIKMLEKEHGWEEMPDFKTGRELHKNGNFSDAYASFLKAAENGNIRAMVYVGYYNQQGKGLTQNYTEALNWYKKASDKGDVEAKKLTGDLYFYGNGVPKNYGEAINWYKKAIEIPIHSVYSSFNQIGKIYYFGDSGVPQNYGEAFTWFKKSAAKDFAPPMNFIGNIYYNGYGVSKNYEEAVSWYKKAAEKGSIPAMKSLGTIYSDGKVVPVNFPEALLWYRKAADNEDAEAMQNVGDFYLFAQSVPQNFDEAIFWYKKAVEKGDANAMYKLGWMYQKGYGLDINYITAVEWYQKSAEKNSLLAMNQLAEIFDSGGFGIKRDRRLADTWRAKMILSNIMTEKQREKEHIESMKKQ